MSNTKSSPKPAPHTGQSITEHAPRSRADWVVERLRDSILLGDIKSGERVHVVRLSRDWNISPTPIREAIQRLASEGLLEVQAQLGARVAATSPVRCLEIYELRAILEPLLVRLSVERFDDRDRLAVMQEFNEYERVWSGQHAVTSEMSRAYMRYSDTLFTHHALPAFTGYVRNLKMQSLRYSGWFTPAERVTAHRNVTRAVVNGDPVDAMAAIVESIRPGVAWARAQVSDTDHRIEILATSAMETLRALSIMYPLGDSFK